MYDADLVERIRRGMHLCSSDYRKWGEVDEVWSAGDADEAEPIIVGHLEDDGGQVYVPSSSALEIKGDKCVRLDCPIAELGDKGWDRVPAGVRPPR